MKAYINLHPTYNYSILIPPEGISFTPYFSNVDWTTFVPGEYTAIMISGPDKKDPEGHLRRAEVVAQRLVNAGVEVYVRNERRDVWKRFKGASLTEDYMLSVELQMDSFPYVLDSAQKSLETLLRLSTVIRDEEMLAYYKVEIEKEKRTIEECQKKESQREKILREFWGK